jgi:formylglycine-generating enzyme required for sulfatase activity
MNDESTLLEATAAQMLEIPAAQILLRDEGTKTSWSVEVQAFLLAQHPVTQALYCAVRGEPPAAPGGPRMPVTEVSWIDAITFCNRLSRAAGLEPCYTLGDDPEARDVVCDWQASGYRLPCEAEWEHACRAGSSEPRYGDLDAIAWYYGTSGGELHEVGTKQPNAWGLHDMIGNVWEWCWDVYDPKVYGPYRVFRGGGWYDQPRGCRASCRRRSHPTFKIDDLGFRLARIR